MGQLKTNDQTEELIDEIQSIWGKIGDPDITRITVVNCALSIYKEHLKTTFKDKITPRTAPDREEGKKDVNSCL